MASSKQMLYDVDARAAIFAGVQKLAKAVASEGDACVVGSAIVNQIAEHGKSPELVAKVGAFVKSLADAVNAVRKNKIVTQRVGHFRPAPADADAGVRQIKNFVVRDGNVARVADADADAAPIFIAAIGDDVIGDGFMGTDFAFVRRMVRKMRFNIRVGKFAELNAVAAEVAEGATGN